MAEQKLEMLGDFRQKKRIDGECERKRWPTPPVERKNGGEEDEIRNQIR